MKYVCYFCKKEMIQINNYWGCLHTFKKRGKMHVRHFYANFEYSPNWSKILDSYTLGHLMWNFKYKRRTYEMLYQFFPVVPSGRALLYNCNFKGDRDLVTTFEFIPNWTPMNCQDKISKVLAFA